MHPFACERRKLLPSKTREAKLCKLLLTKARSVDVSIATLPIAFKVLLISLAVLPKFDRALTVSASLSDSTVCVTYGNACCDGTSERCCMTGVGCVSSGSICSSATGDNTGAIDEAGNLLQAPCWTMIVHPHTAASSRCQHSCKHRGELRDAKLEAMTTPLEVESTKSNVCGTAT